MNSLELIGEIHITDELAFVVYRSEYIYIYIYKKEKNLKHSRETRESPQGHSNIHIPSRWRPLLLKTEHLLSCFSTILHKQIKTRTSLKVHEMHMKKQIIHHRLTPELWPPGRTWRESHLRHPHAASVALASHTLLYDHSSAKPSEFSI